jgi:hypothetical protein
VASSGVVLPALFNTAVGRRELDSKFTDAVVLEISLLPPHHWATASHLEKRAPAATGVA